MRFRGIILTGTSGAGKTTISAALLKNHPSFQQVTAVTTRQPRPDDVPGSYMHLTEENFDALGESLVIWAGYRGKRYGITRSHIAEVENAGQAPVLVITAQSLAEFIERGGSDPPFLSVFLDAPDEILDTRLAARGPMNRPAAAAQRDDDRRYRVASMHVLENLELERSLQQLVEWWGPRTTTF